MPLKAITADWAWYIHPGAFVRWSLPEFRDRCVLCIGPSSHQFAHPQWTALAPVLVDIAKVGKQDGINFALLAEAHRIETAFNIKVYAKFGFKRHIAVPFQGVV